MLDFGSIGKIFEPEQARMAIAKTRAEEVPMVDPDSPSRYEPGISAVLFDMDGVVTNTALIHATAWKSLFDDVIKDKAPGQAPFDKETDYRAHVDGLTREDGVRSFLRARGIDVPEGSADDGPEELTIHGLAARKQGYFDEALARQGVEVFPDTLHLLKRLNAEGIPAVLVTSSRNSGPILESAGITDLFTARVDGNDIIEQGLAGKPAPDPFLAAARQLGAAPEQCVVLEDSSAGVKAAHDGCFGLVIGVDRADDINELWEAGADRVLRDVSTIDLHTGWHVGKADRPDPWLLSYDDFDAEAEGTREALCTVGNGYWATRGAIPGTRAGTTHYPGTYLAGIFNRVENCTDGSPAETEHLINAPDWTFLRVETPDGRVLHPSDDELLDYRQELDLRHGVLRRMVRARDEQGRITRISTEQFQSMADPQLAALRVVVDAENWEGDVQVFSAINGDVRNTNVADDTALETRHLRRPIRHHLDERTVLLEAQTTQSDITVAMATRTTVNSSGSDAVTVRPADSTRSVGQLFSGSVAPGSPLVVDKVATVATSRDPALSTPALAATKRIRRAGDYGESHARHIRRWTQLWRLFHVDIQDGRQASLSLNLHTFHVLQSIASATTDLDAGVPARGLHGEGYRGHIFWDELFVYPMLTLRQPALTRALLLYRYRRLDEARAAAKKIGLRGALFPWQSGSDGREETPPRLLNPRNGEWIPDNSHHQHHIGLAVAFSVWNYHQVTQDQAFLTDVGAELVIEVARLFASNTEHDPVEDRYSISGVMGPDEFHDGYPGQPGEGLRDNTYTNVLASWTLARVPEILDALDPHEASALRDRLDLGDDELERMARISSRLTIHFHKDGVISQFAGYEDLREFPWEQYRERYEDIGRLDLILQDEGDSPNNYRLSKQADLLMLFYLFSVEELRTILERMGYELSDDTVDRTIDFYLERSSDGSSLSQLVHAWVLSSKNRAKSWSFFHQALDTDLSDGKGSSTAEGIHMGAMAGTIDMILRCYGGVEIREGLLVLNPQLPDELPAASFQLHYRGQPIAIHIAHDQVRLELEPSVAQPIEVRVGTTCQTLSPGDVWEVDLPAR